jgi:hypothetical protein
MAKAGPQQPAQANKKTGIGPNGNDTLFGPRYVCVFVFCLMRYHEYSCSKLVLRSCLWEVWLHYIDSTKHLWNCYDIYDSYVVYCITTRSTRLQSTSMESLWNLYWSLWTYDIYEVLQLCYQDFQNFLMTINNLGTHPGIFQHYGLLSLFYIIELRARQSTKCQEITNHVKENSSKSTHILSIWMKESTEDV